MGDNLPDYRLMRRELVKLPAEQLETILAMMLQMLPMPKMTLSNEQLAAGKDLQLLVHETRRGLELESCEQFGSVKPVRIRQTEGPYPVSDQFPIVYPDPH